MNFTPLFDLSEATFDEIVSIPLNNSSFITLGSILLLAAIAAAIHIVSYESDSGGLMILPIALLLAGFVIAGGQTSISQHNKSLVLSNVQEKYSISELVELKKAPETKDVIYTGGYYDSVNKTTAANLSIIFDKETGEPTILTNPQVSEEFVKSLEKTK